MNKRRLGLLLLLTMTSECVRADDLEAAIRTVSARENVSPTLLRAIAKKESSGGVELFAFEPKVFERIETIAGGKFANRSTNEQMMLSSSHGVMHVMGYVAESVCGIKWHELYNKISNLTCAVKVLKSRSGTTLREKLKAYNGAGKRAEAYADSILAMITDMRVLDLGRGIL